MGPAQTADLRRLKSVHVQVILNGSVHVETILFYSKALHFHTKNYCFKGLKICRNTFYWNKNSPLLKDDLDDADIMILDNGTLVFLWMGAHASEVELKLAYKAAQVITVTDILAEFISSEITCLFSRYM